MNTILEYLEQLELSDIEAKLYLKLLKTGAITVSDLARTARINRTTTYLYVDQLIEKELVVKLIKGARTQIAAIQPRKTLPYLVEKKLERARNIQEKLPSILQTFNANFSKIEESSEAEVKYYKGKLGVKKIYEEALQAKEVRAYANLSEIENLSPGNFEMFFNAFKHNKNLILREIVNDSMNSRKQTQFLSQNKRYSYKFFPPNIKIPAADVLIYDGRVSIINVRDKMTGVILQNAEYYTVSKELFDFIWEFIPGEKK